MVAERVRNGKASALGAISRRRSPDWPPSPRARGFVEPFSAVLIRPGGGALCHFMVTVAKEKFGYDDSLDVFGVHASAVWRAACSPVCSPRAPSTRL